MEFGNARSRAVKLEVRPGGGDFLLLCYGLLSSSALYCMHFSLREQEEIKERETITAQERAALEARITAHEGKESSLLQELRTALSKARAVRLFAGNAPPCY